MLSYNLSPRVISANKVVFPPGKRGLTKKLSDHDLVIVFDGKGRIVTDTRDYELLKGDALLLVPGERIYAEADEDSRFVTYFVHFNFFSNKEAAAITPMLDDGRPWPKSVHLGFDAYAQELCSQIFTKLNIDKENIASLMIVNGCLLSLLGVIYDQFSRQERGIESYSARQKRRIYLAEDYIKQHFHKDLTVADIAAIADLSLTHFRKLFKLATGKSPKDYIIDYRLKMARSYMLEAEHNITEIARLAGFDDIHYFSRLFKEREGITPSEYMLKITSYD